MRAFSEPMSYLFCSGRLPMSSSASGLSLNERECMHVQCICVSVHNYSIVRIISKPLLFGKRDRCTSFVCINLKEKKGLGV